MAYLWPLILLLLLSSPVEAKVVTLLNGDQLSGKIKSENRDSLILHHAVLGDITIPKKAILVGPVKPDLPVTSTPVAAPPSTAVVSVSKPEKSAARLPGLFGLGFLEGWKRRLAIGLKGENGNDVSMELSAAFDTSYSDESHRLNLQSAYYYETKDRKKDTSRGHINIVRDWLLPDSDWFHYAYLRYEHDSFKSWKDRISLSGGQGYDFYNDDDLKLSGRLGLGLSRSWGNENELDIEGQLGLEWLWKPGKLKGQSLSYQLVIYPLLNDLGEYRTWMEGKWSFDLNLFQGLGFELGFEHEYETRKDLSLENERYYDLIYFGRLGLDF